MLIAVSDEIVARRCGSATGSARSKRPLTIEKIAVLAPMPSASDSTATVETIGVAFSARTADLRSPISLNRHRQSRAVNENHHGAQHRASHDPAEEKPSRLEEHETARPDDDHQRKTGEAGDLHRREVDRDRRKLCRHI